MRLLAHSLLPTNNTPYLHLGYIAAAPVNNVAGVLGLMGVFLFSALYLRKLSRFLSRICIGAAIACILLIPITWMQGVATVQSTKKRYCRARAHALIMQMQGAVLTGEPVSYALDHFGTQNDLWGRPFRLERHRKDPAAPYALCSDGPDKTPETRDDLVFPFTLTPPKPGENSPKMEKK